MFFLDRSSANESMTYFYRVAILAVVSHILIATGCALGNQDSFAGANPDAFAYIRHFRITSLLEISSDEHSYSRSLHECADSHARGRVPRKQ